MVVLSFSVMRDKVESGEKTRSMRPATSGRWGPVYEKWNDYQEECNVKNRLNSHHDILPDYPDIPKIKLQIYWMQRSKTQGCKLFDANLLNITKKKLGQLTLDECKLDGFNDKYECYEWFLNICKKYNNLLWIGGDMEHDDIDMDIPSYIGNFEVFIIEFERIA